MTKDKQFTSPWKTVESQLRLHTRLLGDACIKSPIVCYVTPHFSKVN